MSVNVVYKENKNSSFVWNHFLKAEDGLSAKCKLCPAIIKISARSTKGLHTHLRTKHNTIETQSGSNNTNENLTQRSSSPSETSISSHTTLGTDHIPKKKKITDFFPNETKVSMEERVVRMVAKDGIPFAKFTTSRDLRELFGSEGLPSELPSSATTIQSMVMAYGASIKKKKIEELETLKRLQKRFTMTFDEWSSLRNRRYLNINLHLFTDGAVKIWNLGLVRIAGSLPAETCVTTLEKKLNEFNINLEKDIISATTDGAAVMKKVGRLLSAYHQLCYAHGVQLSVLDVLYKKTHPENEAQVAEIEIPSSDSESEDDDESQGNFCVEEQFPEVDLLPKYRELIQKVRKIVNTFSSKSPMKNDLLQKYIKADFDKELQLVRDCKTRWSSLAAMITRFNMVKNCISKALIDLKLTTSAYSFTEQEYATLLDIERALEPVQLTVKVLCREDATLINAETALRFMISNLKSQNTTLSNELVTSLLRRIKERRSSITCVLLYLENPKKYLQQDSTSTHNEDPFFYHSRATLRNEIQRLIQRLLQTSSSENQPQNEAQRDNDDEDHSSQLVASDNISPCTLEDELERSLRTEWVAETSPASLPSEDSSLDLILKREMTLFECGGNRGKYLEAAYSFVKSIPPTSVESERAFSASGYLCSKIRSNFNDTTLDTLLFLRKHFQSL